MGPYKIKLELRPVDFDRGRKTRESTGNPLTSAHFLDGFWAFLG
jgi:hypothetical protein